MTAFHAHAIQGTPGDDLLTGTDGVLTGDGEITRLSIKTDGSSFSGSAFNLGISSDGRFMLVGTDGGGGGDLYLKNIQSGEVTLVADTDSGFLGGGVMSGDATEIACLTTNFKHGREVSHLIMKDLETAAGAS
jgi:hypothetical protein